MGQEIGGLDDAYGIIGTPPDQAIGGRWPLVLGHS